MRVKATLGFLNKEHKTVTTPMIKECETFKKNVLDTKCVSLCIAQFGIDYKIAAVKTATKRNCTVMVNPVIEHSSRWKQKPAKERCLHKAGAMEAKVTRPMVIIVKYDTPMLKKKRKVFVGRRAAAACHVIDMCYGKLIK